MTSPSRRDLRGERLRSFGADLWMLLQSQALWSSVKSQPGLRAVRRDDATPGNVGEERDSPEPVTSALRGSEKRYWRIVFVLDGRKQPLMPCTEKRARQMLEQGRAVVHQMAPFTIRLKDRPAETSVFEPLQVKFDPGSKAAGMAIILEGTKGPKVIFFGEIVRLWKWLKNTVTLNRCLPNFAGIQQAIDNVVRWLPDVPDEIRSRLFWIPL